jgi:hypothetical protein
MTEQNVTAGAAATPRSAPQRDAGIYVRPGKKRQNPLETMPLTDIYIGKRVRTLDPAAVDKLAESMAREGQLSPIIVRIGSVEEDGEDPSTILVAGLHRYKAAEKLRWTCIECRTMEGNELDAEIVEISENLHRADLTVLQRAELEARWARLVAEREGQKAGQVAQVFKAKGGRGKKGGTSEAARELGLSRRKIERAQKIDAITPEAKEAAREAGIADNQSKLLKVAAAPAEEQVEAVKAVAEAKAQPVPAIAGDVGDEAGAVADPAEILRNFLDTIERQAAVLRAYKKIFAVAALDQTQKEEARTAIRKLVTKWQSLERVLDKIDGNKRQAIAGDTDVLRLRARVAELEAENAELRRQLGAFK